MHILHHKDRADAVEFDHRTFANAPAIKPVVLALEHACVPAVGTIVHARTALAPLIWPSLHSTSHTWLSAIGVTMQTVWHACLLERDILLPHSLTGALVLQHLNLNDTFHHTHEAISMANCTPGPSPRTAQ